MAQLTLNACHQIGCPKMATLGSIRCADHKRVPVVQRYINGKKVRSFYSGSRWQKTRHSYLVRHPMCEAVLCSYPAVEVDHKQPRALGGKVFMFSNLQALCHAHHVLKTVQDIKKIKELHVAGEG